MIHHNHEGNDSPLDQETESQSSPLDIYNKKPTEHLIRPEVKIHFERLDTRFMFSLL